MHSSPHSRLLLLVVFLSPLWAQAATAQKGDKSKTFGVEQVRDLAYVAGKNVHSRQYLDLYIPRGAEGPVPVLVFVHGGSWKSGNKALYLPLGRAFARGGILLVVIGYRLSPEVKHPAHARDVAAALTWVHTHIARHGGNPKRIFLCGHSAGGHLSALVALDPSYLEKHNLTPSILKGVIPISGVHSIGGSRWFDKAFPREGRQKASPLHHMEGKHPPFLVIWADKDLGGLAKQGRLLASGLRKSENRATTLEIPGKNHLSIIMGPVLASDPVHRAIVEFINEHPARATGAR